MYTYKCMQLDTCFLNYNLRMLDLVYVTHVIYSILFRNATTGLKAIVSYTVKYCYQNPCSFCLTGKLQKKILTEAVSELLSQCERSFKHEEMKELCISTVTTWTTIIMGCARISLLMHSKPAIYLVFVLIFSPHNLIGPLTGCGRDGEGGL